MRRALIYAILLFTSSNILAGIRTPLTSWELGGFIGSSYYIGELNRAHFMPLHPSFGPRFRFNYDDRLSLKFGATYGKFGGNDALSSNSFNRDRNYNFNSQIYEGAILGEFNFLPFSTVDKKSALSTPFLFLGVAYANHNPTTILNGSSVSAQDLYIEDVKYAKNIFSIPFGIGFKTSMNRVSFEFSWGIRKTYTDYLDDVSTNYGQNTRSSNLNNSNNYTQYDDLNNVKRGDQYTKDWYIFSGLSILWSLTKEELCRKF